MQVTIAPLDDVELRDGSTLEQLRPYLATATGRPELVDAPLSIDGVLLQPTQVCGHPPLRAGAVVRVGRGDPDPARTAVRAPWHVAVVDGPDAGHLCPPDPHGTIRVHGRSAGGDDLDPLTPQSRSVGVLSLDDPALRGPAVQVKVRAGSGRVCWRTGRGHWRRWRPGHRLAVGASVLELYWRHDVEPPRWRRARERPPVAERRRRRTRTLVGSLAPLVSGVALALVFHSPALLLVTLASTVALDLSRRLDRQHPSASAPPRTSTVSGYDADPPGAAPATGSPTGSSAVVWSAHPADLNRWLASGRCDDPWRGPRTALDLAEGCLAVVGSPARVNGIVRAMLVEVFARSSPGTLDTMLVGPARTNPEWAWTRWLPTAPAGPHGGPLLRTHAIASAPEASTATAPGRPALCLAVGPLEPAALAAVSEWWHATAPHRSLLLVVDRASDCPSWCSAVLDVDLGLLRRADGSELPAALPAVSPSWAEHTARRLTGLSRPADAARVGHGPLALVDLPGLPNATPGSIAAVWGSAHRDGAPELRAPIGVTPDGRVVTLELSRDGPHALIAGTTGAGKSELLQSLVLSLALQHPPEALALALIDFKGGTSLGPCAGLPHVVGRVSDLDPLVARRAIAGLRAELHRREAVLAANGARDLDELWRSMRERGAQGDPDAPSRAPRPDGPTPAPDRAPVPAAPGRAPVPLSPVRAAVPAAPAPLPRLVVVVDELRALVDDVPEAMQVLARVAAQGRALGMHLVLATQRPAGALSADARANIGIRIALRVADLADSLDVLGIPDAAQIPHDAPGRAVLRVAAAAPVPFQTAQASGITDATAPVRRVGAPPEQVAPPGSPGPCDAWLAEMATVRTARESVRLWQPPLPTEVDLEALAAWLPRDAAGQPEPDPGALAWGLADLVSEQRQTAARWQPNAGNLVVVGRAGTGRSTALHTLAVAALEGGHPVHVVSATPWWFADLEDHPGLGTVADATDGRLVSRLLELLRRAAADQSSGWLGPHGAPQPGPPGAIPTATPPSQVPVLVLDGLPELAQNLDSRSRSGADTLLPVLRLGAAGGLAVVASGAPGHLGRDWSPHLPQRFVFGSGDAATDLSEGVPRALAGLPARPGLGVHLSAGAAVLVQVARARSGAAVRVRVPAPIRLRALPVAAGPPPPGHSDLSAVAIGVGGDTARLVTVDLSERRFLVVGPARSGRSTALAVLARAILGTTGPALVVTRRGPLLEPLGHDPDRVCEVRVVARPGPDEIARAGLVVLDDLDELERGAPEWLESLSARCSAEHPPVVLASARTDRAALGFRGLLADLRRADVGLVLGANAPGSAEVFAEPILEHLDDRGTLAGRGVLLDRAGTVPLQVFRPS